MKIKSSKLALSRHQARFSLKNLALIISKKSYQGKHCYQKNFAEAMKFLNMILLIKIITADVSLQGYILKKLWHYEIIPHLMENDQ
ncbi:hypothetical protein T05_1721 [Trichinella murrelli]|uniref:Uncharacterized protein n=1 Tax=Trichinella murrelli TaxID=144512 RepID=A0A0V0U2Z2_9BILA|nr:hypothetical protein T05_1721 [Trichinella murrelli]